MQKPEWAEPKPVVVSRRGVDALLLATLLVVCLTVGTVVVVIFAKDFISEPSVLAALFLSLGTPLMIGGNLCVAVYWSRLASQARFDDMIELRTLFRRRRYRWTELGRMELRERKAPVPSRFVVKMMFTDGRRYDMLANKEQGEALFRLARGHSWAREWAGAPMSAGMASAFIGLGIVAMFLGLLIIVDPVADVARNGVAGNKAGIQGEDLGGLILVAVVVPLAGLAGIGVGAYHLIRRPIVIRPGIVHLREGDPAGTEEL